MRNASVLVLTGLVLMGCQTPPPNYSTTNYNYYEYPDPCIASGKRSCGTSTSTNTTKIKRPPKVERATEFTGGGRALRPEEW
jgi:hypothetical protein